MALRRPTPLSDSWCEAEQRVALNAFANSVSVPKFKGFPGPTALRSRKPEGSRVHSHPSSASRTNLARHPDRDNKALCLGAWVSETRQALASDRNDHTDGTRLFLELNQSGRVPGREEPISCRSEVSVIER